MDILINVAGQNLRTTTNNRRLVAGTREYIRFVFALSEDWSGLIIFAQFTQNGKSYNKYLNEDCSVTLPQEITDGEFELALQGNLDKVTAKSFPLIFEVERDPITSDASSTEITLSLYDQMLKLWGIEPSGDTSIATPDEVKTYLGITNI